jgi:cell division protein FtsQ
MIAQGLVDRLRPRGTARRSQHYATPRARPRAHGRRLGRRGRLALVSGVAVVAVLLGGWFWFRDSSLVSVSHVTIHGESGPDAARIREALRSAARTMSTLDVQISRLRSAVAPYPIVKDLEVTTQFPHGMRIRVVQQLAVAAVESGGHKIAVAPDGTLLQDLGASPSLPLISVRVSPGGDRVTEPHALAAVKLLSTVPRRLRSQVSQVSTVAAHGLVAQLRNGPSIYFGDTADLGAKWRAASAVLADAGSAGAAYIDVTDPARPAAGSGTPTGSADPAASTGATASASTNSSGG